MDREEDNFLCLPDGFTCQICIICYYYRLCICRPKGSDCGIVNVNIPTSGAEIGGAFGMMAFVMLEEQVGF